MSTQRSHCVYVLAKKTWTFKKNDTGWIPVLWFNIFRQGPFLGLDSRTIFVIRRSKIQGEAVEKTFNLKRLFWNNSNYVSTLYRTYDVTNLPKLFLFARAWQPFRFGKWLGGILVPKQPWPRHHGGRHIFRKTHHFQRGGILHNWQSRNDNRLCTLSKGQ